MTQLDLQQRLDQAEANRDALEKQASELAAENLALNEDRLSWAELYSDEMGDGQILDYAKLFKTPATDAIKRQWMAEGAREVSVRITACEDEFPAASLDIVQECAGIADTCAAQLRQPEEKGHE